MLDRLASLCRERRHFGEAEQYYKQVLAAREELLGPSHPRVAATLEKYAALFREVGQVAEAGTLVQRAKVIRAGVVQ